MSAGGGSAGGGGRSIGGQSTGGMDAIRPADEEEAAERVRAALGAGETLEIRGGGSRRGFGGPSRATRAISTANIAGVTFYEPGALTIIARAGTPLADLEAALASEGQQLAFEPIDHRALFGTADAAPTIGGAVSVGAAGPRRIQAGGARDSLIGARFVNGKGEVVAAGGRVMKNVTGYDLCKLMAGAFGVLGVLTEVAFKVGPKPEAAATLLLAGLDDAAAVEAMSAALGSPFDVTGAAHLPAAQTLDGAHAVTMIRLEGFADSVAYRARALGARLGRFGDVSVVDDPERVAAGWAYVRDANPFASADGAVWRVSVKPTDGPTLAAAVVARRPARAFYDWGGRLVWLLTPDVEDAGAEIVREETAKLGGRATLVRASEATRARVPAFPAESRGRAALAEKVRRAFDPSDLFNPGRVASDAA